MGVVFVEYRIKDQHLTAYGIKMKALSAKESFDWYEGSDQPGLFVELWSILGEAEYTAFKRRRLDPADPAWSFLHGMVSGGAEKIHIWRFVKVEN